MQRRPPLHAAGHETGEAVRAVGDEPGVGSQLERASPDRRSSRGILGSIETVARRDLSMNWKMRVIAGTLALFLAGCAAGIIEEKMEPMIGQPASNAFEKLGLLDAEGEVAGRKFYVWETRTSGSFSMPKQSTGTLFGGPGPSTFTLLTHEEVYYNHHCKMRIFVDSQDRIATYDFDGNEGGCSTFAKKLSR